MKNLLHSLFELSYQKMQNQTTRYHRFLFDEIERSMMRNLVAFTVLEVSAKPR